MASICCTIRGISKAPKCFIISLWSYGLIKWLVFICCTIHDISKAPKGVIMEYRVTWLVFVKQYMIFQIRQKALLWSIGLHG